MTVAVATVRMRPRPGPALRKTRVPFGGLVFSALAHAALVVIIVVAGQVWRASQPKMYIVNLVPAVAAVGSPQGQTRTTTPTPPAPTPPPRVAEPAPPKPTPAPTLPERQPRAPERPTRAAELPDRAAPSPSLPDRSLPPRTPTLPRPGEKELPRVASTAPPPTPGAVTGRTTTPAPPPPPPLGRPDGSVQGVGALTLNAADFPFAWYLRQVQSKISKEWENQGRDGTQPQVVFDIRRDGKISGLAVEKTSGNPLYDQAALRAITNANPFPPLPDEFKEAFLRVHLGFSYSGTRG